MLEGVLKKLRIVLQSPRLMIIDEHFNIVLLSVMASTHEEVLDSFLLPLWLRGVSLLTAGVIEQAER